jgi:hypothetical protein
MTLNIFSFIRIEFFEILWKHVAQVWALFWEEKDHKQRCKQLQNTEIIENW